MIITADKEVKNSWAIKHGLSKHPLYRVWIKIKDRLYNPNHEAYHIYGGNGVVMCEEWKNNPDKFIGWALSNGWQSGLQVDKDIIPEKLGIEAKLYSPAMCSIVTQKENNRHTKYNRYIEYKGKRQMISEWCHELGIDDTTLYHRLNRGMSIEEAFTKPVGYAKNYPFEYNGKSQTINEWCFEYGIIRETFINRRKRGWSMEDSLTKPIKK